MRKLLVLGVFVVLLFCTSAAPALARDTYPPYPALWYAVMATDGTVWWVDEVSHTAGQAAAVPAGYEFVALNLSLFAGTYGQTIAQTNGLDQTLDFWRGTEGESPYILQLGVRDARAYWGRPYDPNAAYGIFFPFYKPQVQSGFWARDWTVWIGPLDAGTYGFHYMNLMAHSAVDQHFEPTPIHYWKTGEWNDFGTFAFDVSGGS